MLDALDQVAPKLRQHQQRPLGQPFFSDPRYEALPLDERRFKPLDGNVRLLSAVDGGNQELVGGASVSLQLVRAYANVFEYGKKELEVKSADAEKYKPVQAVGKRVHQEKHEFLCLTQAIDGSQFESTLLPLSGGLLQDAGVFEIDGRDVADSEERSKAAQVGALTRRFAEWALCEKILGQFDDICVLKDGTLQTSVAKEAFYAKRAQEKAGKGKTLAALSKTSTLLTSTGWSLSDALQRMAPKDAGWAYEWIAQSKHPDHPAAIGYAKLHRFAQQPFRVEMFKNAAQNSGNDSGLPWATLAQNASDPAFLGYPYVLVDADRNAKVSNAEATSWKGLVSAKLGQKVHELSRHTDAHAWLSKL
ncbi:hypothetical protein HY994_05405 [Candidatus Micrarchaeota archaeon]|nr:hypothetical protein [Candidatus Micrarchaeota archaeon]